MQHKDRIKQICDRVLGMTVDGNRLSVTGESGRKGVAPLPEYDALTEQVRVALEARGENISVQNVPRSTLKIVTIGDIVSPVMPEKDGVLYCAWVIGRMDGGENG